MRSNFRIYKNPEKYVETLYKIHISLGSCGKTRQTDGSRAVELWENYVNSSQTKTENKIMLSCYVNLQNGPQRTRRVRQTLEAVRFARFYTNKCSSEQTFVR